jgi:UPF0755 protein
MTMTKVNRRCVWLSAFFCVLAALIFFSVCFYRDCYAAIKLRHGSLSFLLKPHTSVRQLANDFHHRGWVRYPENVVLYARVSGVSKNLRYGEYWIKPGMSVTDVLDNMTHSRNRVVHELMLAPGKTFIQFLGQMRGMPGLFQDINPPYAKSLLSLLKSDRHSPEGLFYPNTYNFSYGFTMSQLFRKAHQLMQQNLQAVWQHRAENLPYKSPYQLLIAASLIESEARLNREQPIISSVLVNRLRRGMYLQFDPTVIYGLHKELGVKLTSADLKRDTPFNTYIHKGLPPTPIDMPGLSALKAAAHPKRTSFIYFVVSAKGDGSHVFSSNLRSHNQAVARYRHSLSGKR